MYNYGPGWSHQCSYGGCITRASWRRKVFQANSDLGTSGRLSFLYFCPLVSVISLPSPFFLSSSAIPLFYLQNSVMCSVMEMAITCDLTSHRLSAYWYNMAEWQRRVVWGRNCLLSCCTVGYVTWNHEPCFTKTKGWIITQASVAI